MRNKSDRIDAALSGIVDPPPRPTLPPHTIWLRGVAFERQRAARRSLRITRLMSAAAFVIVVVAAAVFASSATITIVADQVAAATGAIVILGYTALQLIRSPR